jgi:hypothetical protein
LDNNFGGVGGWRRDVCDVVGGASGAQVPFIRRNGYRAQQIRSSDYSGQHQREYSQPLAERCVLTHHFILLK